MRVSISNLLRCASKIFAQHQFSRISAHCLYWFSRGHAKNYLSRDTLSRPILFCACRHAINFLFFVLARELASLLKASNTIVCRGSFRNLCVDYRYTHIQSCHQTFDLLVNCKVNTCLLYTSPSPRDA